MQRESMLDESFMMKWIYVREELISLSVMENIEVTECWRRTGKEGLTDKG